MKIFIALVCTLFLFPIEAQAQVDASHARAWDRHEGKQVRGKQVVRKATPRQTAKARTAVHARLSPAIASHPVAQVVNATSQILPHPSGCPRRLFCGCGAAVEVFGKPVRHLWLAANWLKYPVASPGPGMVAANRRHVMVIKQYLGNGKALVYDANSGKGLTRLHVRSLAGFRVVNPRA